MNQFLKETAIDVDLYSRRDKDVFDATIELISSILESPMGGICLADDEELHLLGKMGFIKDDRFCREGSFCEYTLVSDECFHVYNSDEDSRFKDSSFVTKEPFMKSYLGMPLILESRGKIGTLFVADRKPRNYSHQQRNILKGFASQIQTMLSDKMIKNFLLKDKEGEMESLKYFVHDLKNPVSIVKTSLDMLKNRTKEFNHPNHRLLLRCQNNLRRVFIIIDEMLNSSRVNNENGHSKFDEINLKKMSSSIIQNMQYLISDHQMISADVEDIVIRSDELLVTRILENLISNAIKYGEGNPINISTEREEDKVHFLISDQGRGIPEHLKEKIFEYGFKKGSSVLPSHGIGLHFCKESAVALGGNLRFINNDDVGTTFIFTIPLKPKILS